jgi:hypothetical protein
MAKKDLKDLLGKKSPTELRKGIQSIDILKEASEALSSSVEEADKPDDKKREEEPSATAAIESSSVQASDEPSKSTEKEKRSTKSSNKVERPNRSTSRRKPKVFSSKDVQAILEVDKRATERYSFEIYSDQKDDIQQLCDLYEQATGTKLSASRLIREVLDTFLPDALKTFEFSGERKSEE